jgi:hypothetical protein
MKKMIVGAALGLMVVGAPVASVFAGEIGGNGQPTPIKTRHVAASIGMTGETGPRPLWLDDIEVGRQYRTTEHLLEADEIIEFASRYDPTVPPQ